MKILPPPSHIHTKQPVNRGKLKQNTPNLIKYLFLKSLVDMKMNIFWVSGQKRKVWNQNWVGQKRRKREKGEKKIPQQ